MKVIRINGRIIERSIQADDEGVEMRCFSGPQLRVRKKTLHRAQSRVHYSTQVTICLSGIRASGVDAVVLVGGRAKWEAASTR
jgi:hypothetical protein